MDTRDVSEEDRFPDTLNKVEDFENKALQKKGQLVQDHTSKWVLIQTFMIKLMSKVIPHPLAPPADLLIPIHHVPAPYPPSIVPLQDLEPISISELGLEIHHWGKKIMLHIITPPERRVAVMVGAEDEDEKETAVVLHLYQQAEEKELPLLENTLYYSVCIVKEPFFKKSIDGPYSLRVDHPSDIIWLDETDDRIPQKWREPDLGSNDGSKIIRAQGNEFVKRQDWSGALHSYSQAIQTAKTSEDKQLAYLNRSLINLKFNRPAKALVDALQGQDPDAPTEKSLFREVRALYELGRFDKCREKLQTLAKTFPKSQAVEPEIERVKARLNEQQTGEYSFKDMYEQSKATPPLIDCATFSSPVEIRDSHGRGRGLFTTKPVSARDLLLCEKAFSYYFIDEDQPQARGTILMNMSTKKITMGGNGRLLPQVAQKLYHNPEFLPAFQDLYHGDYEKVEVIECDGNPVIDSFLIEKIISLNAINAPRTSRDFFKTRTENWRDPSKIRDYKFPTSGLWLLASKINHSCIGNCRRSFIGDMQIIRAATDLPAGTELLFSYRYPSALESYQDVQKQLRGWGFECQCELCKERSDTSQTVLQRRRELHRDFWGNMGGDPAAFDFAKAERLLKAVEKTYPKKHTNKVRLELAEFRTAVGNRYVACGQRADSIKMYIKGLEAFGFVIVACPPGETTNQPRLEVQRRGIADDAIPAAFLNFLLIYRDLAPELCQTARDYAEVAYSMVTGEKDSFLNLLVACL
ncbi:hypothetical protein NW762_014256 [Fusarium torreyae]|uniref:SET domain-containing protein n=1 Tax=Fusarium torreyae TaxID=1237075 RepID=A0A9W8RLY0_9HYPO|nr:hypothetical protein NW762_014256 [Fusarium torreyae]